MLRRLYAVGTSDLGSGSGSREANSGGGDCGEGGSCGTTGGGGSGGTSAEGAGAANTALSERSPDDVENGAGPRVTMEPAAAAPADPAHSQLLNTNTVAAVAEVLEEDRIEDDAVEGNGAQAREYSSAQGGDPSCCGSASNGWSSACNVQQQRVYDVQQQQQQQQQQGQEHFNVHTLGGGGCSSGGGRVGGASDANSAANDAPADRARTSATATTASALAELWRHVVINSLKMQFKMSKSLARALRTSFAPSRSSFSATTRRWACRETITRRSLRSITAQVAVAGASHLAAGGSGAVKRSASRS